MLRIPMPEHLNPRAFSDRMERAGFHAVNLQIDGGDLIVRGATEHRLDEWGGHAMIDQSDVDAVQAILAAGTRRGEARRRAKELRAKPNMTQPEVTEAIRLLMDLVLDDE